MVRLFLNAARLSSSQLTMSKESQTLLPSGARARISPTLSGSAKSRALSRLIYEMGSGAWRRASALVVVLALLTPAWSRVKETPPPQTGPQLQMDGGRKLTYEGSFSSERE